MNKSIGKLLLAGVAAIVASPGVAADVTAERLTNADKEPHNWLMNHRTYDAQRYSPLENINKGNIKNLKLAYAVAIGGTSANENLQATPLAEDGYLYVVDHGAWSTKSTAARAKWGASSGAWTPARRNCRCRIAVPRSGAIW